MKKKKIMKADIDLWGDFLRFQTASLNEIDRRLAYKKFISLSWYDVLIPLYLSESGQMRLKELAEKCLLTKSGISKILNTLEKEGLVERLRCPDDARGFNASITGKGKYELKKAWTVYGNSIEELFLKKLSSDEKSSLKKILLKLNS